MNDGVYGGSVEMRDKVKGDVNEKGLTYKIDLKYILPFVTDDQVIRQFDKLSKWKIAHENRINQYNHLIELREEIATIPDEYFKCGIINKLMSIDDMRKLLIIGCEKEIEISGKAISDNSILIF